MLGSLVLTHIHSQPRRPCLTGPPYAHTTARLCEAATSHAAPLCAQGCTLTRHRAPSRLFAPARRVFICHQPHSSAPLSFSSPPRCLSPTCSVPLLIHYCPPHTTPVPVPLPVPVSVFPCPRLPVCCSSRCSSAAHPTSAALLSRCTSCRSFSRQLTAALHAAHPCAHPAAHPAACCPAAQPAACFPAAPPCACCRKLLPQTCCLKQHAASLNLLITPPQCVFRSSHSYCFCSSLSSCSSHCSMLHCPESS